MRCNAWARLNRFITGRRSDNVIHNREPQKSEVLLVPVTVLIGQKAVERN